MILLFWLSALLVVYVYAGYPVLLEAYARLRRPDEPPPMTHLPSVSIVIAARNEAQRLPSRLDNLLAQDYPADRREIIVVSDGSTDDTVAALAPYLKVARVVTVPGRGKAAALNTGVALATNDVIVFADARQRFAPDALRALTSRFADPAVGAVTGELLLDCEETPPADVDRRRGRDRRGIATPWKGPDRRGEDRRGRLASTIADGIGLYWRYEKRLRRLESRAGSTIGATGAIYALRRDLWRPLPPETILDDVLTPMRAVLAGTRVAFEERAKAFDSTAPDAGTESRRKIRTLAGNVQILWLEPRLLVPFVNPVWVQYMSHKVGRLVVPYALLALFAASVALANRPLYGAALAAQCGFYLLGAYGAWLETRGDITTRELRAAPRAFNRDGLPGAKGVVNA